MAKKIRLKLPPGWKMEEVTPRMRTGCSCCGKPCVDHRFKHIIDGYPFPEQKIYRSQCAVKAMRTAVTNISTMIDNVETYLRNNESAE